MLDSRKGSPLAVAAVLALGLGSPSGPEITSGPARQTAETAARFTFSGDGRLRCRLDHRPAARCRRTARYRALAEGRHVFTLWKGRRRATYAWSVDLTRPPRPVLTSSPDELSATATARFSFTGEAPECRLDDGPWRACRDAVYEGLIDGPHRFAVLARDKAGNASVTTTYGWTIDTTPPPAPTILAPFVVSGPGAALRCSLDGVPVVCDGASELPDGDHLFTATAVDAAGNESAAATYRWTVDTTPPPAPSIARAGATLEFSGSGESYVCRLDDGPTLPCSSPHTLTGLSPGTHTFSVQARDKAGNRSSPATITWAIERYRDAILATPGLRGYWRLGEAEWAPARDELGALPGRYSGGVTLGAAGALIDDGDTASAFDGLSGEVLLPGPVLSGNATLEGWFDWRAGVTVLRDHTSGAGWILALDASGTGASVVTARAAGRTVTTTLPVATRMRDGWHHVVLTKAGANLAFYLDGGLIAGVGGAGNAASVAPWHLMNNGTFAEQYAEGRADEIAFYDRALDAAEIAAHFRLGRDGHA